MHHTEVMLLVYGKDIGALEPRVTYTGVTLRRTVTLSNDHYRFLYLDIDPGTAPGDVNIDFLNAFGETVLTHPFSLLPRQPDRRQLQGYGNADVLCLVTPDRFANGNPANDNVDGMPDRLDRQNKWGRHGGDIRGLIDHLDYFADMGFTALWLNPILENNQPEASYHGYATTDFYRVDARFGSNEEYLELAEKARAKGIRLVMDMIMNHCGSGHWWMQDLPAEDWVHEPDHFFETTHRRTTWQDPYASPYDIRRFADGWFVPTMPDLNQRQPELANYLIQHSVWWIEYLGLAGIRMDTYPYSDKDFMARWSCTVMDEYPHLNMCGEEWSLQPLTLAYWQRGKVNPDGYVSCLPGLLDFPLQHGLAKALVEEEGWNTGWVNLYETTSYDGVYADPFGHVIFPDNHDMSRIFTQLDEDVDLLRLALVYFATMRGTPQFYYGTEVLMSNKGDDSHGNIRSDFPGGWAGDPVDAFQGTGLRPEQLDMQAFFRKLLQWRKTATAIHEGKLMHFAPRQGVYVYFRYQDTQQVMVVLNKSADRQTIDLAPFADRLAGATLGREVLTDRAVELTGPLSVGPKQALVLEIRP
jgi:glycosidase